MIAASMLSLIALLVMVNLTTPSDVGPLGVLVFFTLAYLVCLGIMVGACKVFFALKKKMNGNRHINSRASYYYGSILAFAPILLLFMRSLGELNFLEVILVALFVVIGCFYLSKRL